LSMPGDPGPGRVEELASHNRITLQENRKAARVSGLFCFYLPIIRIPSSA
jgi:hypothetical protein